MGIEPDGECFGKILDWMRLRIPIGEVDHIVTAMGAWLVGLRIRHPGITKQSTIAIPTMQFIRIVDRVPGFMPEDPPALGLAGTFHFEHLTAFEPHEAAVRQIERNRESHHAIRVEELLRKPGVRTRNDTTRL